MEDNIIMGKDEKWQFDNKVAEVFDNMLLRSIPDYNEMRRLVDNLSQHFLYNHKSCIDLGCSNGLATQNLVNNNIQTKFYLYDVSQAMLDECKKRYQNNDNVMVQNFDVCSLDIVPNVSLVLSILTLQFIPLEKRQEVVQRVYSTLEKNGAFILVEKVLGNTYLIDKILTDEYYNLKMENQYTQEQIQTKRKSLEGILSPITAKWNENLLKSIGFAQIDCFWRDLNFAGWIAIK